MGDGVWWIRFEAACLNEVYALVQKGCLPLVQKEGPCSGAEVGPCSGAVLTGALVQCSTQASGAKSALGPTEEE